jgi:hypothetical protein
MAGPVLGIGLTVTGVHQPLRRPRLAGSFGARPVPVSGEGDRTVGRRGS